MIESVRLNGKARLAVLLLCAGLLAGCDAAMTSMAQSMSESENRAEHARLEAQGNPQFSDPDLQAIVREFEAEYARFGRDAEKLKADAATLCPLAPRDAFKVLRQVDYEQQADAYASYGLTQVTDIDGIEVRVVSGSCDAGGVEGPAEVVGSLRTVSRMGSGELERVTVTDSVERIRGTWAGGERQGPFRIVTITRSASFEPDEAGALEADVSDWSYLNEIRDAPTATWLFMTYGAGQRDAPGVTFARNPESGLFTTSVTEQRPDGTSYSRTYVGAELRIEGAMKDGNGWQVHHPYMWQGERIEGQRQCFQNGELIKTTDCPFD